jgi:hypothetical protein
MSCRAATEKPVCPRPAFETKGVRFKRDKLAQERIDACASGMTCVQPFATNYYGRKIMDPTIGVVLVVGFPAALVFCLWLFGKVSVRPE